MCLFQIPVVLLMAPRSAFDPVIMLTSVLPTHHFCTHHKSISSRVLLLVQNEHAKRPLKNRKAITEIYSRLFKPKPCLPLH